MAKLRPLILSFVAFTFGLVFFLAVLRHVAVPVLGQISDRMVYAAMVDSLLTGSGRSKILREFEMRESKLRHRRAHFTGGDVAEPQDLSMLLQTVYDLAWKAGRDDIRFLRTAPQPETVRPGRITYPVVLEIRAGYESLHGFVARLESIPFVLRIEGIALRGSAGGDVEATIVISGFVKDQGRQP